MTTRVLFTAALLSYATLGAAEPWVLYFADQDSSKITVATFEVWDEDGNMQTGLPETYNRTQCLYVADFLSRSSQPAYPDNPDRATFGCTPADG